MNATLEKLLGNLESRMLSRGGLLHSTEEDLQDERRTDDRTTELIIHINRCIINNSRNVHDINVNVTSETLIRDLHVFRTV